MCGITGLLRVDDAPPDLVAVRAMTAALAHRGPDGEGFFEEGPVAFGHRRLSILDLSPAGSQPMRDASGRFVITFNGEIYNFVELRDELASQGVRFRSGTDTEVILEAYAKWGPPCVSRFNGMFAFAIWDREKRTLFLARDRYGEKPLYYRWVPGKELRFASELKALVPPGTGAGRADPGPLYRFLAFHYAGSTAETFVEGVHQVPHRSCLLVKKGRLEVRPWWDIAEEPAVPEGSEAEIAARVGELVEDSVRIRLRSDVPVGTSLSGGIDSSTIVLTVARLLGKGAAQATTRRATFSSAFPGHAVDESRHIDAAVQAAEAESHRVTPDADEFLRDLPRLVAAQDEPFGGPSIYAHWKVMELAKSKGVVVLLDGQGADELFAGYHFYFGDLWWGWTRAGEVGKARRAMAEYDAVHGAGRARRLLAAAGRARVPRWIARLKGGPSVPWLDAGFAKDAGVEAPVPATSLRDSLRASRRWRMLPHLLRHADRNSMAFSREVRLPFLDHRLVELVDALPDDMKLRGGTTKWVLREAIQGLVPESIRTRTDKIGFAVPFHDWLRGPLAPAMRDAFSSARFRERGIHDAGFLGKALDRFLAGETRWADTLWNAFAVEHWMRAFTDGPSGRG